MDVNFMSFKTHIAFRLATLVVIQENVSKLKERDEALKKALSKLTPSPLWKYLTEEHSIDSLLQYGESRLKINYSDEYDFKNAAGVKKAFEDLAMQWDNSIKVSFADKEPHRITVTIKTA